jgi:Glycosyl transferase 4-like domain
VRRVLIITYYYPPRQGIGSLRPGGLAKFLPQFSWEPIVLTPRLPEGAKPAARVVATGYRDIFTEWKSRLHLDPSRGVHEQLHLPQSRSPKSQMPHTRILAWIKQALLYPDPAKGWLPFATQTLVELAKRERFDAILSTAPPISCQLLGATAKMLLQCPWVADCRDLWVDPSTPKMGVLAQANRCLEKKTLSQADALVTVSKPLAAFLQRRYPERQTYSVMNGFDPDDHPTCPEKLTDSFTITYTGALYEGVRDPTPLFQVLGEMTVRGEIRRQDLELKFYGAPEPWLAAWADRHGLGEVTRILGNVERSEALKAQRTSQVLLLLGMQSAIDHGCYTGKLFEYLASRRPILAVGGTGGVVGDLLTSCNAGVAALSKEQLKDFLIDAYGQYRTFGSVQYRGRPELIDGYSQRNMAKRFAEVLDSCLDGRNRKNHDGSRVHQAEYLPIQNF